MNDRAAGGSRISRAFGLTGDSWLRHANPVSVWSRFSVPRVAIAFQVVGLVPMIYGLVVLDGGLVVVGVLIIQLAKLWYIDRMVLLFDAMKAATPGYASWDY